MDDRTWCISTPRIYSHDKAVSLDNDVIVHGCYRFPHTQRILGVADLPLAIVKRTNTLLRSSYRSLVIYVRKITCGH